MKFSIEPFDLTNTARSVYDFETFARVKAVFVSSWRILQDTLDLQSIFTPVLIPLLIKMPAINLQYLPTNVENSSLDASKNSETNCSHQNYENQLNNVDNIETATKSICCNNINKLNENCDIKALEDTSTGESKEIDQIEINSAINNEIKDKLSSLAENCITTATETPLVDEANTTGDTSSTKNLNDLDQSVNGAVDNNSTLATNTNQSALMS